LLTILSSADARADTPRGGEEKPWATVRIHAPDCETSAFRAKAFLRLLDVELLAEHLRPVIDDTSARSVELTVTIDANVCDTGSQVLAVRLSKTGADEVKRFIELGDVPLDARPRAVALAVVEHIRQTRARQLASGSASIEPASDATAHPFRSTDANEPVREAHAPPLGTDVAASGAWRDFIGSGTSFFGANVAVSFPLVATWLRAETDVAALFTSVADPLGNADVSYLSAGLGALVTTRGTPTFFLGPHLELGRASITSNAQITPVTTHDERRAIVLVSAALGMRAPISSHWGIVFELEMGGAARGVKVLADDRAIGSLDGAFASARAGFAFAY
jgi:hypothetical protein